MERTVKEEAVKPPVAVKSTKEVAKLKSYTWDEVRKQYVVYVMSGRWMGYAERNVRCHCSVSSAVPLRMIFGLSITRRFMMPRHI